MNPDDVRALFPIMQKRVYMLSGGIAPTNTRALEAMRKHLDYLTTDPSLLYLQDLKTDFIEVRRLFALLMGADEDEIAVVESTSSGTNIAVDLIDVTPGGNVVFDEWAYPSTVYPFMLPVREKLEKRFVKPRDGMIHLEDMEKAIDDNTVAVAVSHVTQGQGFRQDIGELAKIAHAHGALLIVDRAQSAGAIQIDLHESDVDFFSCCAMKWLLGAPGIAFLYVARRNLDRVPSHAGYAGNKKGFDIHDFELHTSAERFQLGMPNLMGLAFTKPGLEILLETGMDVVERHVLDLSGYCIAGLRERGVNVLTSQEPEHRLGRVVTEMDDAQQLWKFLYDRGVDTRFHGNLFRLDPHVFNNRDDIDRFLGGVDDYQARHSV
ncbi:MAG: aminotransferase class V-fold PLP-dependent enzyme [SAR202 cluster bacterium]|nr:aminotransferase class V-fold PLP-dependent enzyme [SAR202 cluster bacterium]